MIKYDDVMFVKEHTLNGMTYEWFVCLKPGRVSDCRSYVNYENGKTVAKEYSLERLPSAVKKFVRNSESKCEWDEFWYGDKHFVTYIYKGDAK